MAGHQARRDRLDAGDANLQQRERRVLHLERWHTAMRVIDVQCVGRAGSMQRAGKLDPERPRRRHSGRHPRLQHLARRFQPGPAVPEPARHQFTHRQPAHPIAQWQLQRHGRS